MRLRTAVTVAVLFAGVWVPAAAQMACSTLTGVRLSDAVVTVATEVPAGPFTPPAGGMPGSAMPLPGYGRVQGVARPTGDSEIKFEVWLPAESGWTGKFQQAGNGGSWRRSIVGSKKGWPRSGSSPPESARVNRWTIQPRSPS